MKKQQEQIQKKPPPSLFPAGLSAVTLEQLNLEQLNSLFKAGSPAATLEQLRLWEELDGLKSQLNFVSRQVVMSDGQRKEPQRGKCIRFSGDIDEVATKRPSLKSTTNCARWQTWIKMDWIWHRPIVIYLI